MKLALLDQLSTSPTDLCLPPSKQHDWCVNGAPFIAYRSPAGAWYVVQGCCNSWTCPRCGQIRARKEYGRIVEGCKILASQGEIWFLTVTSDGGDLTVKEAEENYIVWTNRFLDACRARCKRKGGKWCYVQVTERQKRKHPHSHILTTFNPLDCYLGHVWKWRDSTKDGRQYIREIALRSDWLQGQVVKSGLGEQYDISKVNSVEGAARYVAKYLFKASIFTTDWPPGWKRIRYAQSFPKNDKPSAGGMVLLSREDWYDLACDVQSVIVTDNRTKNVAEHFMKIYGVNVVLREGGNLDD